MSYRDPEFRMLKAGEYVLGTLSDDELDEFLYHLEHDSDLGLHVVQWQEDFQPIATAAGPVIPSPAVWNRLSDRLDFDSQQLQRRRRPTSRQQSIRGTKDRLNKKLVAWQWAGSLAMAASALLAVALWQNTRIAAPIEAISVVSGPEAAALWVVQASIEDKHLRITAVAPPTIANDQDHQLWLVKPDNAGVVSLGLLPKTNNTSVVIDAPQLQGNAVALAVSLEPAGGSLQAGPSGPVLYQGSFQRLEN